jgi:hypothetical protein
LRVSSKEKWKLEKWIRALREDRCMSTMHWHTGWLVGKAVPDDCTLAVLPSGLSHLLEKRAFQLFSRGLANTRRPATCTSSENTSMPAIAVSDVLPLSGLCLANGKS